jgi:glycosyltransferase involved in cell wall biosynthesis
MASERTLIVIPAFNEAGRVGTVVRAVHEVLPGADVLVVDDGSTDGTGSEATASTPRRSSRGFSRSSGGATRTW